jgi:hypothetical protein
MNTRFVRCGENQASARNPNKKIRISGDSYGESGDALFWCVLSTGTWLACAFPRIILFALYAFYNILKFYDLLLFSYMSVGADIYDFVHSLPFVEI